LSLGTVGRKFIRTIADPVGTQGLSDLGKEGFDLCGTFYPFHKQSEDDLFLGQCGLHSFLLKTALKLLIQIAMLCLSCNALGFFDVVQNLPHAGSFLKVDINLRPAYGCLCFVCAPDASAAGQNIQDGLFLSSSLSVWAYFYRSALSSEIGCVS
jgi:hypothetical protein